MSLRQPITLGLRRLAGPVALSLLCSTYPLLGAEGAAGAARPDSDTAPKTAEPAEPTAAPKPAAAHTAISAEAKSLLALGAKLTDRGDFPSAEVAFRQILDRRGFTVTDQKPALLGLARMYRKAGNLTKTTAVYEKFVKEFPDDDRVPDSLLDLGRTLRAMGAYKLALSRFYSVINSTLKVDADQFDHYQQLAKTAEYEIAETYYEAAEYSEAGKYFMRLQLLDLAPVDRARALFMAAHSQLLAGETEAAVHTLHTFLDQWPTDENMPEAMFLLATSLRQMNRPQEALQVTLDLLKTVQNSSGADPRVRAYWQRRTGNLLANDFFQNGDTMSALAIYRRLVELDPTPAWCLPVAYQVGLCYERLHMTDKAKTTYQTIIDGATAKPGATAPDASIVELAHMATWRLNYIAWLDDTAVRLNVIETPGLAPERKPPAPPSPPS